MKNNVEFNNSKIFNSISKDQVLSELKNNNFLHFSEINFEFSDFINFSNQYIESFSSDPSSHGNRPTVGDSESTYEAVGGTDIVLPHGELYSLPEPPDFLFLYCHTPAKVGGETTIFDAKKITENLSNDLRILFLQRSISYRHFWNELQWTHFFKTTNFKLVLEKLNEFEGVKVISNDPQNLIFTFETFAINKNGRFVNGISNILSRKKQGINHVTWSNGEEFYNEIIAEISHITNVYKTEIKWKAGEMLMINNHEVMHGRNAFINPRKISVRFGKKKI